MIQKFENSPYQYVSKLDDCTTIDQIKQVCQQYLHTTNVEFFKYSWQPPAMAQLDNIAFWTCGEKWMSCYQQKNYADKDPKTRYAENYHLPIFWDANLIKQQLTKEQANDIDFWQDSIKLGVAHGVTIPIRGVVGSKGSLCIALDTQVDGAALLPNYEVWAMYVHSNVERIFGLDQLSESLSKRELEVLKLAAVGQSCEQTAQHLFISNNTVLFHLRNLRKKLGVVNKHQMIAKALSLRLVDL